VDAACSECGSQAEQVLILRLDWARLLFLDVLQGFG
jgi:hypothetical protein